MTEFTVALSEKEKIMNKLREIRHLSVKSVELVEVVAAMKSGYHVCDPDKQFCVRVTTNELWEDFDETVAYLTIGNIIIVIVFEHFYDKVKTRIFKYDGSSEDHLDYENIYGGWMLGKFEKIDDMLISDLLPINVKSARNQ